MPPCGKSFIYPPAEVNYARGNFDAVVDFDAVVRDPSRTDHLLPAYDCGDHLHPSPDGYKAMGESIPLTFFAQ